MSSYLIAFRSVPSPGDPSSYLPYLAAPSPKRKSVCAPQATIQNNLIVTCSPEKYPETPTQCTKIVSTICSACEQPRANRTPGSHPLLEQMPLTVSPFVSLPTATTLPYTYKSMPSTLPPSSAGITSTSSDTSSADPKPKYVISQSGHAAHPDDIIASCRALQAHIGKLQADAEASLREFDERIRARDLAEKRRLAPGWLDSDVRVLEPERKTATPPEVGGGSGRGPGGDADMLDDPAMDVAFLVGGAQAGHGRGGASEMAVPDEGEQIDRAFGGLALGK